MKDSYRLAAAAAAAAFVAAIWVSVGGMALGLPFELGGVLPPGPAMEFILGFGVWFIPGTPTK
jgi:hypothetical protein